MTARIGLPVCRSIVAFGKGAYREAVEQLMPIRHNLNEFGGSHAQRDAVQRTLLEAALRSGSLDVAELVLGERMAARPESSHNWLKQGELERARGEESAAGGSSARRHARARRGSRPPPDVASSRPAGVPGAFGAPRDTLGECGRG